LPCLFSMYRFQGSLICPLRHSVARDSFYKIPPSSSFVNTFFHLFWNFFSFLSADLWKCLIFGFFHILFFRIFCRFQPGRIRAFGLICHPGHELQ